MVASENDGSTTDTNRDRDDDDDDDDDVSSSSSTVKHENAATAAAPSLLIVPPSGPVTAHALRLHPGESLMGSLRNASDVILARLLPSQCSAVFVMTTVGSLKDVTLRLANASKVGRGDDGGDGSYNNDNNKNKKNIMKKKEGAYERNGVGAERGSEEGKDDEDSGTNNNVSGHLNDDDLGGVSLGKPGGNEIRRWENTRFEIVSLVGTFSRDGGCHLHIALSDGKGRTIGGHLIDGVVFTTVEVVLGTADGVEFRRCYDDATGYRELVPWQLDCSQDDGVGLWRFLCAWSRNRRGRWWDALPSSSPLWLCGVAIGIGIGMAISSRRRRW